MDLLRANLSRGAVLRTRNMPVARPSPSMFYYAGLETKPVWTCDNSNGKIDQKLNAIKDSLIAGYQDIVDEYLAIRLNTKNDYQLNKDEHQLHKGKWDWNSYILQGVRQPEFAISCPKTATILESTPLLMHSTPFSFAFFSTLHPNTIINPHYGPTNIRLRCHFPLIIPKKSDNIGMNIGNIDVKWREKEPLFFDDTYEHSVYNHTEEERVVLLFDIFHPSLHNDEIHAVIEMFDYSKKQGWLK